MGLITKEVEITLRGRTISYYENLGYEIPRYYNNLRKKYCIKEGTTIFIKTKDLPKGSHQRVDVACDGCGTIRNIGYDKYIKHLHDGKSYCHDCGAKILCSGENNPNWRADLTQEEREKRRNYPEYTEFVKRVQARDRGICQCCGLKDKSNVVHHLNGYSWYVEGRTDDTNGIVLCKTCHSNFHSLYGNKHSTKEQFEEWLGKTITLKRYNEEITSARKIYCVEDNKVFENAKALQKEWGLKSDSSIYSACNRTRGVRCLLNKHIFWLNEYENLTEEELQELLKPAEREGRLVICLTTGEIFPKLIDASKAYGLKSPSGIGASCRDKTKTAGKLPDKTKLYWMYYDEFLQLDSIQQKNILKKGRR